MLIGMLNISKMKHKALTKTLRLKRLMIVPPLFEKYQELYLQGDQ